EYGVLFESVVRESGVAATTVAAFLTETLKSLKREGIAIEKVTDSQIKDLFKAVGAGEIAKEAVQDVFVWLSKNEGKSCQDAMAALGLKMVSKAELAALVDRVIAENRHMVDQMGAKAFGMLMGAVMREVRGKAEPAVVSALLKERLS
ncbi:MAG: GatB/YqeY domain-containing protein, partial [Candidatus Bathyarchaeia archaeon]